MAGKIILPSSCMAMVFFREPWYLWRNKHLFSYEVPGFQIFESEFRFSDSPDIGIQKIFSNRNLWNRKQNRNSAYNGGPRNQNQKLEFPTKIARMIPGGAISLLSSSYDFILGQIDSGRQWGMTSGELHWIVERGMIMKWVILLML